MKKTFLLLAAVSLLAFSCSKKINLTVTNNTAHVMETQIAVMDAILGLIPTITGPVEETLPGGAGMTVDSREGTVFITSENSDISYFQTLTESVEGAYFSPTRYLVEINLSGITITEK